MSETKHSEHKQKKKHNKSLEILLIVLVIIIAVSTVAYVLTNKKNVPVETPVIPTNQTVTSISLDRAKVPKNWVVTGSDADNVLLDNKDTTCFVSVNKIPDKAVKASDTTEYYAVKTEEAEKSFSDKGYSVQTLPRSSIQVQTNQGDISVATLEFKLSGPQAFRQSYGYIVRDGYVVQVQRSCTDEKDLPSTLDALRAVTVNI
jgi:hypothetical protein